MKNILDYYLELDLLTATYTLASVSSFSLVEVERILLCYQKINLLLNKETSSFYEKMKENIVNYVLEDLQVEQNIFLEKIKK